MKTRLLIVVALVLCALRAGADVQVVVVGGDPAPDGNGQFFDFDVPSMNRSGQIAVVASLQGTSGGSNDNTVIVTGTTTPGSLALIVRKSNPSPDGNGNFSVFDPNSAPLINDGGQIAFVAGLSGTFGNNDETALFRSEGTPVTLTRVIRQGQPLPDSQLTVPNLRGGGASVFSFNEAGQVVLRFIGSGIFRSAGDAITAVVHFLEPIPNSTGMFTNLSVPALNDSGQVAFSDTLQGFFRFDEPTITSIARIGDASADGNGVLAFPFIDPAINNRGDVAFHAMLTGTTGGASDNQGIYIRANGGFKTIVRRGQNAPDGNGRFLDFSLIDNLAINEAGQVAFMSTLTNTRGGASDNVGIFRGDGTTLTQIARIGDRAPDGSTISMLLARFALNDAGQVAFLAGLSGTGGPRAILLYDDQRGVLQAVRSGDPLLGTRIAASTIFTVEPSTTFNGKKRSALNQQSQIVFRFDLDDGRRGIAIANPLNDTPTPVPTATPTPTRPLPGTATPTRGAVCVGDCDRNGRVSVSELVLGVNIALNRAQLNSCPAFDCRGTGRVPVDCLVSAVNAALRGCP